jgi:hypothetical protein
VAESNNVEVDGFVHGQAYCRACMFRPWLEKGDGFMLEGVPSADLQRLAYARPTIGPSFAEGSDLSGVEVMMLWGAVVASDIPVHREINADAAGCFNRPSVDEVFQTQARIRIGTA